ncbi:hypothetical protein OG352_01570 [Streptomyces sp. NBC_01485]|uniref:DUF6777 domain-containing protein n=1 Tax=Streptomyces sp. NBC_01485 TaxID=2903884 RepID=UPI002E321ADC|nr:DUF6777 domain-containing protein [Streptomyces sp. NBC_01485]
MSVEPPSSGRPSEPPTEPTGRPTGRPAGPPSGPLSGPSQPPPSGPPSEPPVGDSPGGGGGWEPRRPWWKSAPRVALITTAVVAATALALVLTLPGGGGSNQAAGEVFMQPAGDPGPDSFTGENAAKTSSASPASVAPQGSAPPGNTVPGVSGGQPGLYGGTLNVSSCDVALQIKYLQQDPAKNKAFASVAGVDPAQVPGYLRSLTPVQLRLDTRVTNHGYRDGAATTYQAILQAGTAVMVDGRGVPRVRCACGNPLTPPVAQQSGYKRTGHTWSSYSPSTTVVVNASVKVVNVFVLYDPHPGHHWIARRPGGDVHHDRPTRPPAKLTPSITVSTPGMPTCVSPPTGAATGKPTGCVPPSSGSSSKSPGSKSPSKESPSKESPSTKPPSSESHSSEPPSSRPPSSEPPSSEPPSSGSRSEESGLSEPPSSLSELTDEPESSLSSLSQAPPSAGVTSRTSSALSPAV